MKIFKEGLVHIYTGNGKGKTTAAVGLALRAIGAGLSVCLIQFLKGYTEHNEIKVLKKINKKCKVIRFKQTHPIFCLRNKTEGSEKILKKRVFKDFLKAKKEVFSKNYDLVIMDEIINIVSQRFLSESELIELIDTKPKYLELVLTGRGASKNLIKKADYVTDMRIIRHPFYAGKKSRRGIEY